MIQMKVASQATSPAKGAREYGTSAYYGCGTGSAWKSNSQLISAGCRMEIRARLRGQRNGFNMGIWLMSDDAATQKTYSEIDILEIRSVRLPETGHIRHSTVDLLLLIRIARQPITL